MAGDAKAWVGDTGGIKEFAGTNNAVRQFLPASEDAARCVGASPTPMNFATSFGLLLLGLFLLPVLVRGRT
jgi:hypothetical protein